MSARREDERRRGPELEDSEGGRDRAVRVVRRGRETGGRVTKRRVEGKVRVVEASADRGVESEDEGRAGREARLSGAAVGQTRGRGGI